MSNADLLVLSIHHAQAIEERELFYILHLVLTLMLIDECFQAFNDELVGAKIPFSSHADDLYD